VIVNTDPRPRDLLVFGVVLAVVVAAAGFIVGDRASSPTVARAIWVLGGALVAAYVAIPPLRRPVFVGTSYATYPIGWVVSHVLLFAIFALVITPIALLVRAFGDDPLARAPDPSATTYWTPHKSRTDLRLYFKQF